MNSQVVTVVFYLDNDAARSGLIRAEASTRLAQAMIAQFAKLEKHLKIYLGSLRFPVPVTQRMMPPD